MLPHCTSDKQEKANILVCHFLFYKPKCFVSNSSDKPTRKLLFQFQEEKKVELEMSKQFTNN
eukprot:m.89528 g.89528  ORF g.89528 m.89528 type:complete len:62 (+) comp13226_c0_seq5:2110-2295(+)